MIYAGLDPRSGKQTPPAVPVSELLETLDLTARTADQTAGAPRPHRAASAAALRRSQLPPRRAGSRRAAVQFRPGGAARGSSRRLRAAGAAGRALGADGGQPGPAGCRTGSRRWPTCCASSATRCGPCCATGPGCPAGARTTSPMSRSRPPWPVWTAGRSASGCWASTCAASRWTSCAAPNGGAASLPPRLLRTTGHRRPDPAPSPSSPRLATPFLVGDPERFEVVRRSRPGAAHRQRGSGLRRRHRAGQLLPAVGQVPAAVLGRAAGAHRRPSGRDRGGRSPSAPGGRSVLGPVGGRLAGLVLADLIDLQRTGLAEPIPFAPKTSAEYARIRLNDWPIDPNLKSLEKTWTLERDDLYEQFFGAGVSLETLLAEPSRPERGARQPRRAQPVRHPRPPGLSAAAGQRGPVMTEDLSDGRRVRRLRRAAGRHDGAGGQRRDGKDLHAGRAGRPLRRRRTRDARPVDAGHLRPDGHQRTPRAGARATRLAGSPDGRRAWPAATAGRWIRSRSC